MSLLQMFYYSIALLQSVVMTHMSAFALCMNDSVSFNNTQHANLNHDLTYYFPNTVSIYPETNTVFVDLQAEFVCRTNGVLTDWKINDTLWSNHDLDLRSDMRKTQDENYNKVLTSSNTSKYNNTEVQCISFAHFDSSTYVGSNIVTLRIQGIFCSLMSAWIHFVFYRYTFSSG